MASTIVLITGANTGLGFETVKALCQSKKTYTILLGGRSLAKAQAAVETAQSLRASSSTKLEAVQIDIEDDASISALVDKITKDYKRLDVLINNAGKCSRSTSSSVTNIRQVPSSTIKSPLVT